MGVRQEVDAQAKLLAIDKTGSNRHFDECIVVRAASGELRKDEIVDLETPSDHRAVLPLDSRQLKSD